MASQKMFSDLVDLTIGDVFYLDVLREKLAYEVKSINTVLPYQGPDRRRGKGLISPAKRDMMVMKRGRIQCTVWF